MCTYLGGRFGNEEGGGSAVSAVPDHARAEGGANLAPPLPPHRGGARGYRWSSPNALRRITRFEGFVHKNVIHGRVA
jgi:hypothetical protein